MLESKRVYSCEERSTDHQTVTLNSDVPVYAIKAYGRVYAKVMYSRSIQAIHHKDLPQGSATYGMRAKRGTRNDFQWHAE
jgi:hypothetical protein